MASEFRKDAILSHRHNSRNSFSSASPLKASAPSFWPRNIVEKPKASVGFPISETRSSATNVVHGSLNTAGEPHERSQEGSTIHQPYMSNFSLPPEQDFGQFRHVRNGTSFNIASLPSSHMSPLQKPILSVGGIRESSLNLPHHAVLSYPQVSEERAQSTSSSREKMLKALQRNSEFSVPMQVSQSFKETRGNSLKTLAYDTKAEQVIDRYMPFSQPEQSKIKDNGRRSNLVAGLKNLALERQRKGTCATDVSQPQISQPTPLEIVAPHPRRQTQIRLIEEGGVLKNDSQKNSKSVSGRISLVSATSLANENPNSHQPFISDHNRSGNPSTVRVNGADTPPVPGYPYGPSVVSPVFRPAPENSSPFPPFELEETDNQIRFLHSSGSTSMAPMTDKESLGLKIDSKAFISHEQSHFPTAQERATLCDKEQIGMPMEQIDTVKTDSSKSSSASRGKQAGYSGYMLNWAKDLPSSGNAGRPAPVDFPRNDHAPKTADSTDQIMRKLGSQSCQDCFYFPKWFIHPCKHLLCTGCASIWLEVKDATSDQFICGRCLAGIKYIELAKKHVAHETHNMTVEAQPFASKPSSSVKFQASIGNDVPNSLLAGGLVTSADAPKDLPVNNPPESVQNWSRSDHPPPLALGPHASGSFIQPAMNTPYAPLGSFYGEYPVLSTMASTGYYRKAPQAQAQLGASTAEEYTMGIKNDVSKPPEGNAGLSGARHEHMPTHISPLAPGIQPYFMAPPNLETFPHVTQSAALPPAQFNPMYLPLGPHWNPYPYPEIHTSLLPYGNGWPFSTHPANIPPASLVPPFGALGVDQNNVLPTSNTALSLQSGATEVISAPVIGNGQGHVPNFGHLQAEAVLTYLPSDPKIPGNSMQHVRSGATSAGPLSQAFWTPPNQHLGASKSAAVYHSQTLAPEQGHSVAQAPLQKDPHNHLPGPSTGFGENHTPSSFLTQGYHGPPPSAFLPMGMPLAETEIKQLTQDLSVPRLISYEQACRDVPFIELVRHTRPAKWGVIKISNIPYNATKPEIFAFLGRNAKTITPDLGCAIHIIMERGTAKTMDCFVEFLTTSDAITAVNRFSRNREEGRAGRIGDRHVEVELSGQEALMKEIFPKAKNVTWHGADPNIFKSNEPYNTGFKGFLSSEELVMMLRHAEVPNRSPFAVKCLQRTYEFMISTLAKYPWWAVDHYTIKDRDLLFHTTEQMLRALVNTVRYKRSNVLDERLLDELLETSLKVPGFNEKQKARLVSASELTGGDMKISRFSIDWPFETLVRKPNAGDDVVEYFAYLFRRATMSPTVVSLAEHSAAEASKAGTSFFGNIVIPWPTSKEKMSFSKAAAQEWDVVEGLLRRVLCSS